MPKMKTNSAASKRVRVTGSYTLVTPQGKLYFAQLREMILLVS